MTIRAPIEFGLDQLVRDEIDNLHAQRHETLMRHNMFDENDFQRFKQTLQGDAKLREIVDLAIGEAVHGKRREWLIPYINAPGLRSKPWKKTVRRA